MRRYYIVEGDKTTAGGIVQKHTGAGSTTSWHGKTVSNIEDKVDCPACKSMGVIQPVGDRHPFGNKGFIPALNDDLCICKCSPPPKLIHSQSVFYQNLSNIPSGNDREKSKYEPKLVDTTYRTQLVLVNEEGIVLDNYHYKIDFNDGTSIEGKTDKQGKTEIFDKFKELVNIWYQINKGVEI